MQLPPLLLQIPDRPEHLNARGLPLDLEAEYLAIVGTRRATEYGLAVAYEMAAELTRAGFTIVSGLAYGIDQAAHRGALDAGGKTVAVLGTGFGHCNAPLAKKILAQGTILTEYEDDIQGAKYTFPQRNRIIAGMSVGTIVVEAPERSGALITAELALEYNRDVFAVPGNILQSASLGCNRLIRDGLAYAVSEIRDVLNFYHKNPPELLREATLEHHERLILTILESSSPTTIDLLAYQTGLDVPNLLSSLTMLEMKKLITLRNGYVFVTR